MYDNISSRCLVSDYFHILLPFFFKYEAPVLVLIGFDAIFKRSQHLVKWSVIGDSCVTHTQSSL